MLKQKNNFDHHKIMSQKNKLQEYFQNRRLELPKYISSRCGGSDHKPFWRSRVKFWSTVDNNYKEIVGDIVGTKIKAEMSAAELALEFLSPTFSSSDSSTCLKVREESNQENVGDKCERVKKTAIFVDVENLQKFVDQMGHHKIDDMDIYAFVGYHHHLSEKIFPKNVTKILSPSTRPDGSDTCMQIYIGYLLAQEKYDKYIIATRDHYGSALVDMITSDTLLWKKKDAYVVTQVSHIK